MGRNPCNFCKAWNIINEASKDTIFLAMIVGLSCGSTSKQAEEGIKQERGCVAGTTQQHRRG